MSSSSSYLAETLSSLSQSAAVLKSLSFSSRAVLPPCVLSPDDWFEHHLIRDAAPAELALYEPNPASYPVVQLDVDDPALLIPQDDYEANRLAVAKRKAPKRAQIAQEALRAGGEAAGGGESDSGEGPEQRENNPQRCLMTAQKLLNYYAMPRAQEHVQALHSQLVGLMDSIHSTEEALRRPPSRTAPQPQHDQSYYRQLELEDEIKREKLELLALEQIKADKQAEIDALARKKAAAPMAKPRPRTSVPSTDSAATSAHNATAAGPRPLRPRTSRPSSGTSPRTSRPARPSDPAPPSRRRPSGPPAAPAIAATVAAAPAVPMPPASPARRPIGRPSVPSVQSAMKRRVEQARAKVQASQQATPNRSQAFAAAAAGRRASGLDTGAQQQEEEEEEEDGAATPKGPKRVGDGVDGNATEQELPPAVPTVSTVGSSTATPPNERKQPPPLQLPADVTLPELEGANKTIWSTMGESSGLRQWMRKWARETGSSTAAVEGEQTPWSETIEVLEFALAESAKASAQTPGSPSSHSTTSFATSATAGTDENAPPAPWSPAQVVEAQLCYLLLSTFSGRSIAANPGQDDLPALNVILRETAIPLSSSIAVGGSSTSTSQAGLSSRKTPHLAMAALKVHLGAFAKRRGWTEEMGTTAIYALVSRQTVKIDRRGREGAAVGFKAVEL